MNYAAAIAADVSSRYGVAVSPAVVRIVPRGASGIPAPIWNGARLVHAVPVPFQQAPVNRKHIKGAAVSKHVAERRVKVRDLHSTGATDAELAEALGVSYRTILADRNAMGLEAHRAPAPPKPEPKPRAVDDIARRLANGEPIEAIAQALGKSLQSVRCTAAKNGIKLPRKPLKTRATSQERLDIVRRMMSDGASRKAIIAAVGMRRDSLARLCKAAGVELPPSTYGTCNPTAARAAVSARVKARNDAAEADIIRLHGDGLRVSQIVAALGIPEKPVYALLRARGMMAG